MRIVTLILLVMFSSPSTGLVSAQTQRQPEPDESVVTLAGFRLKGGVVNLAEGDVDYVNGSGPAQRLKSNQTLENGDVIHTGTNGRVEVLLNPGYYLRLSGNTQATFLDLSRDNLKVKISYGSAILEVLEAAEAPMRFWSSPPSISAVNMRFAPASSFDLSPKLYQPVTFFTTPGDFVTMTGGLYRFDVSANGTAELKVTKGMAVIAGKRVARGMRATVRDGAATLTEFKTDFGDPFDNWSRNRAALLIEHNKALRNTSWSRQLRRNGSSYFKIDDDERTNRIKKGLIVSAIGGLANFVEDGVMFKSEDSEWKALSEGVGLKYGDRVRTGEESRAEILVYAICYLHLASNTEIIYSAGPDGGVAVQLLKGSAIITYEPDGKPDTLVTLIAPQARYEILKSGVYRLNIVPGGTSEIIVYEGTARVAGREVKTGKKAVFQSTGVDVLPIDKKADDAFDVWSRTRPVPSRRRDRVTYLRARFEADPYQSGMWYFDPAVGAHTFVPGAWSIKSPYGGKYRVKFAGRQ